MTADARPRPSRLLLASLALTAMAAALPGLLVVGPFVAGILAFLGDRKVRASGGTIRGPALSRVAMTAALVVLVIHAFLLVRNQPLSEAAVRAQTQTARVEDVLRAGTPEGAFDLLAPAARAAADRAAFLESMRAALSRLGALRSLGRERTAGGEWTRMSTFLDGESADIPLAWAFDAEFERGKGTVTVEAVARRRGRKVAVDLVALRVEPR